MKWFFGLVGFVAALKLLVNFGVFIGVLWIVPVNISAELACLLTLALLLGGAVHYARRGTVIPPRPLMSLGALVAVAPLLALALAGPALHLGGTPVDLVFESCLLLFRSLGLPAPTGLVFESWVVLFQMVGLWAIGGVLFGGPFACPEGQHAVHVHVDGRPLPTSRVREAPAGDQA